MKSVKTKIGSATLVDYGSAEFLDGVRMRYCVMRGEYRDFDVVAYVADEADALVIAKAIGALVAKTPR